jgi:hypothetical protein
MTSLVLIKDFHIVPRAWPKVLWFGRSHCDKQTKQISFFNKIEIGMGDLNMTSKTNKQPSLIERLVWGILT